MAHVQLCNCCCFFLCRHTIFASFTSIFHINRIKFVGNTKFRTEMEHFAYLIHTHGFFFLVEWNYVWQLLSSGKRRGIRGVKGHTFANNFPVVMDLERVFTSIKARLMPPSIWPLFWSHPNITYTFHPQFHACFPSSS